MSQFAIFYMTPSLSPIKAYSGVYATTREPPNEPPSSDASMLTLYSTSCDVVRMDTGSRVNSAEKYLWQISRAGGQTLDVIESSCIRPVYGIETPVNRLPVSGVRKDI